ncbi:hypothetical protein K432DRAFT_300641 [Lepidopterella palustris CBS 459.81]|uniref:F-box domain-containing protein n=1 Tax=Lepidopterella palustris CBS 459.81 TaxID=1314670 RepID=A0A8E2E816_9PEZI|nr:hypothetical protein K432DRAFT_300641 [Lepidopterella palustris CBS 459.81]
MTIPSPAISTVLETTELLELILSHLPLPDLLRANRINKTFFSTIKFSPKIQSLLFFRPTPRTAAPEPHYEINPLLTSVFPGWLAPMPPAPDEDWDLVHNCLSKPPAPNDTSTTARFLRCKWNWRPDAFARADASWRRMFVTQPPVKQFSVEVRSCGEGGESVQQGALRFDGEDDGLRMGMLYDYLEKNCLRQTYFRPRFCIWIGYESEPITTRTLNLELSCFFHCTSQAEEMLPGFRSDGFEDVQIEMTEKSMSWDENQFVDLFA